MFKSKCGSCSISCGNTFSCSLIITPSLHSSKGIVSLRSFICRSCSSVTISSKGQQVRRNRGSVFLQSFLLAFSDLMTDRDQRVPCVARSSCGCAEWVQPGSGEEQQGKCL